MRQGVSLLLVYSLGLGIPFILAALAIRPFMRAMQRFRGHLAAVEKVLGGFLGAHRDSLPHQLHDADRLLDARAVPRACQHRLRASRLHQFTSIVAAMTAIALTIAGSDSSGGAGIQADLQTFSALGVYGASAITALTAQNTQGVEGVHGRAAGVRAGADRTLSSDLDVGAIKIGMLARRASSGRRRGA